MRDSPYLESCRLGDVIAALQVLAYYKFYRLEVDVWTERISGSSVERERYLSVFVDHPEFFQVVTDVDGSARAALVARRSFSRSYHVDEGRELTTEELAERTGEPNETSRLSRRPLTPDETAVLIRTAVDLHSRAVEQRMSRRWWIPLVTALIGLGGVIVGAILGSLT